MDKNKSIFNKHLPEVLDIKKGNITPINTEDFKKQLKNRIDSEK